MVYFLFLFVFELLFALFRIARWPSAGLSSWLSTCVVLYLSRLMTKPTKSLSAWRKLGSLATHWAHSEDWSDWADAQADLSLRWAHSHFVGFVMRRLIWWRPWCVCVFLFRLMPYFGRMYSIVLLPDHCFSSTSLILVFIKGTHGKL